MASQEPESYISDLIERHMLEAVRNSVNDAKRSLLDFVEQEQKHYPVAENPLMAGFLDVVRKRIHNDVSGIEYKMRAIITVAKHGGEIPRFGRTEEERSRKAS